MYNIDLLFVGSLLGVARENVAIFILLKCQNDLDTFCPTHHEGIICAVNGVDQFKEESGDSDDLSQRGTDTVDTDGVVGIVVWEVW